MIPVARSAFTERYIGSSMVLTTTTHRRMTNVWIPCWCKQNWSCLDVLKPSIIGPWPQELNQMKAFQLQQQKKSNQGYDSNFFCVLTLQIHLKFPYFKAVWISGVAQPTSHHTHSTSTGPTPDSLLEAAWRTSKVGAVRNGGTPNFRKSTQKIKKKKSGSDFWSWKICCLLLLRSCYPWFSSAYWVCT